MPWGFGVLGGERKQEKGPGWRLLVFQDFLSIHLLDFEIYPNKLDLLALNYFFLKGLKCRGKITLKSNFA